MVVIRCKAALLALALAAVTVLAGAGPTAAHFQTAVYTFKSCDTGASRVDPINTLFFKYANTNRVINQIQTHANWRNNSGTTQYFKTHGTCGPHHAQRANGTTADSRYHIRFHMTTHTTEGLGTSSVGDAHHEDWVFPCGHAVDENGDQGSGFDMGRRKLRRLFQNAGHYTGRVNWGNTRNFKQCDDDYAGSDGWVVTIRIHYATH